MQKQRVLWLVALLGIATGLRCDASLGPDDGPTMLRFVSAAPVALIALDMALQGGPSARLQPGQQSPYIAAQPRSYTLNVRDEAETWTLTGPLTVVAGLHQTLIAFGHANEAGAILLGDEPGQPRAGQFLIRIAHLAPDIGTLDVHFLTAGAVVDPARAGVIGMSFPAAQNHFNVNAGTWRIVLTQTGTSTIVHDSGPITFAAGEVHTYVLHNSDTGSPLIIRLRDG